MTQQMIISYQGQALSALTRLLLRRLDGKASTTLATIRQTLVLSEKSEFLHKGNLKEIDIKKNDLKISKENIISRMSHVTYENVRYRSVRFDEIFRLVFRIRRLTSFVRNADERVKITNWKTLYATLMSCKIFTFPDTIQRPPDITWCPISRETAHTEPVDYFTPNPFNTFPQDISSIFHFNRD